MFERELRDGIAVVRMTHGKANAIDVELCRHWVELLDEERAGSARGIVITGHGGIFSAGVDLLRIVDDGPEYAQTLLAELSRMVEVLFLFPKPVVAAVNGHAIAGGCVLACATDYRVIAAGDFRVGVPELLVGVPFPAWPLEVMRFVLPAPLRARVLLKGEMCGPDDAVGWGLADEVAPGDELLARSIEVARALARVPAAAFAATKAQLREPPRSAAVNAGAIYDEQVVAAWRSDEVQDAIRAYVARTLGKGRDG